MLARCCLLLCCLPACARSCSRHPTQSYQRELIEAAKDLCAMVERDVIAGDVFALEPE
jgi:hypothetical protein